ncbi:SDR family NAD(P)-dependent oxidoreductase [Ferruginivarius sediminum]|uniref:SDR family NAD(P)-dependent oxidoreductase n=1 Tax=Ferruginivarius sediminum TaxID=2661937 RepID=A0A369TEM0_9PROT|nr:SDR family NAD(P)-dependent oxidoreductase [Ferruginivarius sediminum]RDD63753.1 SDR family NAD(P)-dependent oxidoreductase [Ferruginivarius sediminum]
MAGRLQDKVAIVTGAGSSGPGWGNGKAASVLFAREGARVVCVDLNESAAEETAGIIREEGHDALAIRADVANHDDVKSVVDRTVGHFGRVDVLHNNVGIVEVGGPVEASEESWDRVMNVNLKSMFLTCKYVLPIMQKQKGGAIVNVSSIAGIRWTGVPYISYSASKSGALQFTRSVALQYASDGVRANSILPGLMNTPMIVEPLKEVYAAGDIEKMIEIRDQQCPMGRMGDAWDVAYAALFLASDEAKYVTATELVVDGGITGKFA